MDDESVLDLPGFRFHPTEEELLNFYLKSMVFGKKLRGDIIGFLNIYNHDPRDLPGLAKIGEREWYFFVPRDRKHGSGGRPNRTTETGFWKATGSDRKIFSIVDPKKVLGLKKTLVFYEGRAPRGTKTDWVMNEYRLPDSCSPPKDIVLCKIYRKATSMKVLEQRAAMGEETKKAFFPVSPLGMDCFSFCDQMEGMVDVMKKESEEIIVPEVVVVEEDKAIEEISSSTNSCSSSSISSSGNNSLMLPYEIGNLAELQMPKMNMDWTQDSFWTQLRSPWLENFVSFSPMC